MDIKSVVDPSKSSEPPKLLEPQKIKLFKKTVWKGQNYSVSEATLWIGVCLRELLKHFEGTLRKHKNDSPMDMEPHHSNLLTLHVMEYLLSIHDYTLESLMFRYFVHPESGFYAHTTRFGIITRFFSPKCSARAAENFHDFSVLMGFRPKHTFPINANLTNVDTWIRSISDKLKTGRCMVHIPIYETTPKPLLKEAVQRLFQLLWNRNREFQYDCTAIVLDLISDSFPCLSVDLYSESLPHFSDEVQEISKQSILKSMVLPHISQSVHHKGGRFWNSILPKDPPKIQRFDPFSIPKQFGDSTHELIFNLSDVCVGLGFWRGPHPECTPVLCEDMVPRELKPGELVFFDK